MTISVGTPTTDQDNGVSSVTFSHTVTAGKGRQLLVGVSFNNDNFETITGITYDGNALTLVVAHDRDDDSRAELWRLQDPPVGTANVVVTLDGTLTSNAGIISGAVQFDEVDSTTPVGATASADGDNTNNTVDVSSNTGELVIEVSAMEQGSFLTPGTGQTVLWNLEAGSGAKVEDGASSHKAGASPTVTMEWTNDDDKWVIIAASFRPSVAPVVDAGGPYNGPVGSPTALNATVTPGTDPAPTFLWTIDSGPGSGVFTPSATVEDPSFNPDTGGAYTLRLTVSTVDAPDVFDTATFTAATPPTVDAGGPYSEDVGVFQQLAATVTPGTDPSPSLLWTVFSGPGGGTFGAPTTEDAFFRADAVGTYTLRLTATPNDGPPVFDDATFEGLAVPPVVDAGGPYTGNVTEATALDATVTPGTDPTPVITWSIDAGPGTGTFLPTPNVEDPTFTPDALGTYTLKISVNPSDGPPVEDTASFESVTMPESMGEFLGGRLISKEGELIVIELAIGEDPPANDVVFLGGIARSHLGPIYVARDDGIVARIMINGQPVQHNGVMLIDTTTPPDVNLAGWAFVQQPMARHFDGLPVQPNDPYIKGVAVNQKGGVHIAPLAPAQPPAFADLTDWFSTTQSAMFVDAGGLTPALRGDEVVRINNLGQSGQDFISILSINAHIQNQLFTSGCKDVLELHQMRHNAWPLASGATGMAFAGVFRNLGKRTGTSSTFFWSGAGGHAELRGALLTGSYEWEFALDAGIISFDAPSIPGEWVWMYVSVDSAGNYKARVSGALEKTGVTTYNVITAGSNLTIGPASGGMAEFMIWDRPLTDSEIDALVAYFGQVYDTLPFQSEEFFPPRQTDLRHWYDLTDNCQVYADAAGTTRASAGSPVQLIRDKSYISNAQVADLDSVSPGSSDATYRTAFLNGRNVAEFGVTSNINGIDPLIGDPDTQSIAVVFRQTAGVPNNNFFIQWRPGIGTQWGISGENFLNGYEFFSGTTPTQFDGQQVQDKWFWAYLTYDSSGNGSWRVSGLLEKTGNFGTFNQVPASEAIHIMSGALGEVAEALIWDHELSEGERCDLAKYFEDKYGISRTTPFSATPLQWYDFGDQSTIFTDAAGTQRALDGQTIVRINDKGSAGEDLVDLTSTLKYNWDGACGNPIAECDNPDTYEFVAPIPTGFSTGFTMFVVAKSDDDSISDSVFLRRDGSNSVESSFQQVANDTWRLGAGNPTANINTLKNVDQSEWIWAYTVYGASGVGYGISGRSAVAPTGPAWTDFTGGGDLQLGEFEGKIGELMWFEGALTPTQIQEVIDYIETKYNPGVQFMATPPAAANLQQWYDFTDDHTVFSDIAGTTPAGNGDNIRNVTNKGNDQNLTFLNDQDSADPTYRVSVINGLNVFSGEDVDECDIRGSDTNSQPGASGMTLAWVVRRTVAPTTAGLTRFNWDNSPADPPKLHQNVSNPSWDAEPIGTGGSDTNTGTATQDEWVWQYMSIEDNNVRMRTAGNSEIVDSSFTYTQQGLNQRINIQGEDAQIAECLIWDRALTTTELDALIDYFDQKYGVMPF